MLNSSLTTMSRYRSSRPANVYDFNYNYRSDINMASPAVPGLFFCFAAAVLLVFVSVSAPTWESISFLNVHNGDRVIHFGVFGYTGTGTHIGYNFDQSILGFEYVYFTHSYPALQSKLLTNTPTP